jgi:hypothetical protein
MTTRHSAYIVVLRDDIREDEDEAITTALRMVSGVLTVKPVPHTVDTLIAEERARNGLGREVLDAVMAVVYPERRRPA